MFRQQSKHSLELLTILPIAFLATHCRKAVPPPSEETPGAQSGLVASSAAPTQSRVPAVVSSSDAGSASSSAAAQPSNLASGGDPLHGKFSLADATEGLKSKGRLWAELATEKGTLRCELYEDKAPNTVANFVGLARGLRPFKDPKTSEWVKRPAYDGTGFHRIVKGFMIQGGDPTGTGAGEPGYVIPDEIWPGATHDKRGLLCMANRGANTNGMQFFILDGEAKHLDASFTIFGRCSPDSIIAKLASSEVRGDRTLHPPKIKKVTILRK